MCEYCHQYRCPPSCPAYEGISAEYGRPRGICRQCGMRIYRHEGFYQSKAALLCESCAEHIFIRKYEREFDKKGGTL